MPATGAQSIEKPARLRRAIASIPPGRWGVAVSGGADSTALLHLLQRRKTDEPGLFLCVIHVNHELRGPAADADAAFVANLADHLSLPHFSRRRSEIRRHVHAATESNLSASLRRLRLEVYRQAVERFGLDGVILAQHRDDLTETLLIRLLRGSGQSGLLGLTPLARQSRVAGVPLLRPILDVSRASLRRYLRWRGLAWREDESNRQPVSLRNRLRQFLETRPGVQSAAVRLLQAIEPAESAIRAATPTLETEPAITGWPTSNLLARRAGRNWLIRAGVPQDDAGPAAVERLLALLDTAGPRAVQFAGGVRVERRRGRLRADKPSHEDGSA